ncbi:hypothetical protein GW16_01065 [Xanthomonas arboricola pv. celebensis]|nr:hypothetical protein GW16_01065 [Xanthomonas arboricola pv. celebensis]
MYRLGHLVNGEWAAHSHLPVFDVGQHVIAGAPGGDPVVFERLVECLEPPYYLLYVLHTPRGEALPGRYQSPALSLTQVKEFLARFAPFLSADARFDLWAYSPGDKATVVWDRHNQVFGYGPLERYSSTLRSMGFALGWPEVPAPHEHHYREEFDALAKHVLTAFDWSHSPLRPEDEQ